MTKAPATIMYASLVSRETVRIALMIAALNDLEVKLGNILNAHVQAPVTEKVLTTLSLEFTKDVRKTQQEQLSEATLLDAWNLWVIGLAKLTLIYGLNWS